MAIKKKSDLVPSLKESAYHIWLAGLGAYSVAGEEGNRLFKQLVDKGAELDEANKERILELAERAKGLKGDAKGAWDKLSTPFEGGLATAMHRLGVPTREEIVNLTQRVEELTKLVAKTKATPKPAAKPAAKAAEAPKRKSKAAKA